MRVPQVNERVKEAPAQALRAMFSGIGQLLLITDRFRNRDPESETAQEQEPTNGTSAHTAPAEAPAEAAPAEAATADAGDQTASVEAPEAEATVVPEAAASPVTEAVSEPAAESSATEIAALPLPNYDELTIPSLRARLRNLSTEQLNQLIDYEKSHANRVEVISMFERRIAKLAEG